MTPQQLGERLALGEDARHEFKSVAHNGFDIDRRDLAQAIVALANTSGGRLILGADDDGTASGIGERADADRLLLKVSQVCREVITPAIACVSIKVRLDPVTLLVVEVPAFSPDRPYRSGKYYLRDGAQSREASPAELRRLLQSADDHYDEEPVPGASFSDLDVDAIRALVRTLYDEDVLDDDERRRYLRELKCLDDDAIPTVTGYLFWPGRRCWPTSASRCGTPASRRCRLPTTRSGTRCWIVRRSGGDSPPNDGAFTFLERHVSSPAWIEGTRRVEGGIPLPVLREAIVNAVTHRDYRTAAQTRLFVFPNRVEVHNPGELLNRLTLDNIRAGISQRRNPIISSLLNRLGRRESIGSGVPRMREAGLPAPQLAVSGGEFQLTLHRRG